MKIKFLGLMFLTFGLVGIALAKTDSVPPVYLPGLPLVINHSVVPGQGNTKTVSLSQFVNSPAVWNVTCNYVATETGKGQLPISILIDSEGGWGNYPSSIYVDGNYAGSDSAQATLNNKSGTIEYTNLYDYKFDGATPYLEFTNVDGTGNVTLTQCVATYVS